MARVWLEVDPRPRTEEVRLSMQAALKTSRLILKNVSDEAIKKSGFLQTHKKKIEYLERVLDD